MRYQQHIDPMLKIRSFHYSNQQLTGYDEMNKEDIHLIIPSIHSHKDIKNAKRDDMHNISKPFSIRSMTECIDRTQLKFDCESEQNHFKHIL